MTNKTIGFTDAMIKALPSRGGCKTQTRRLMKPQPVKGYYLFMPDVWVWETPCGNGVRVQSDTSSLYAPLQISDILTIRGTDIKIEITGVRVERVQDITPADCEAEGVDILGNLPAFTNHNSAHEIIGFVSKREFAKLIDSIYGEGTYDENKWVWVYEFKEV